MTRAVWLRDSITSRLALAIAAAVTVCIALNILADSLVGMPNFNGPGRLGSLDRLASTVRSMDATPLDRRDAFARSATNSMYDVAWQRAGTPAGSATHEVAQRQASQATPDGSPVRKVATPAGDNGASPLVGVLTSVLTDGSFVTFTPREAERVLDGQTQWTLRIGILIFSIAMVSVVGASRLARPIDAFAAAARRFGVDPNAEPMPVQGPAELRLAIAAFNTMQSQIQRFIAGQAAMFAAISHDLRTPLTRIRLRGEFIADPDQQARLFRDVAEMQTMVTSVLTFLRDNAADEQTTSLDLAELLRSIADDYADIGCEVAYTGPRHMAFPGRPVGLRRAFGNLVDNAVKYGARPAITLLHGRHDVTVIITDQGPGIPPASLEIVFAPFQRLEPSRNRNTGGMGLGLTSARVGFRAHGGDVVLANGQHGGLRATVTLPLQAPPDSRRGSASA